KRYRVSPGRANRAISGISMGGYGALHLAFRHPQLFSAVSAHSAALIEKLPAFLGGSAPQSNQPNRARIFGGVFGSPPDPAYWNQQSPIRLARTANLAGLKIYFDCGDQDDYGFDAGAAVLDKVLTARHMAHEFHLYPAGTMRATSRRTCRRRWNFIPACLRIRWNRRRGRRGQNIKVKIPTRNTDVGGTQILLRV